MVKTLAGRLMACGCGIAFVAVAACIFVSGCAPAPAPAAKQATADHDHDHDADRDVPDTFAGGVTELEKVIASAKAALAERNLDDADGHVHMVGHLVDDLHRLAKSAQLSDEARAAAAKALDEVFECFDALDTQLHASEEEVRKAIDYAKHEPRVEAAVKALKDLAAPAAADKQSAADVDE